MPGCCLWRRESPWTSCAPRHGKEQGQRPQSQLQVNLLPAVCNLPSSQLYWIGLVPPRGEVRGRFASFITSFITTLSARLSPPLQCGRATTSRGPRGSMREPPSFVPAPSHTGRTSQVGFRADRALAPGEPHPLVPHDRRGVAGRAQTALCQAFPCPRAHKRLRTRAGCRPQHGSDGSWQRVVSPSIHLSCLTPREELGAERSGREWNPERGWYAEKRCCLSQRGQSTSWRGVSPERCRCRS